MEEFFYNVDLLAVAVTVISLIWGVAKGWVYRKASIDEKAAEAIEAGVAEVYLSYVKPLKDANEDGKLTAEEKKYARDQAYKTALRLGGKAVKKKGPEWGAKAIELAVSYFKKAGK